MTQVFAHPLSPADIARLEELDRTHWLHPMGDLGAPAGSAPQVIFSEGSGSTVRDVHGRSYVDAIAGLWNVNVGWGRTELAEAAAEQMRKLAFESSYGGFGHEPGIRLAEKLAEIAPGDLPATFFASGGAEANDTAYKLVRLYWRIRGEPERVTIVSRMRDYHGLAYGALSATGLPMFWKDAGPLAPGFVHAPAPDPYRFDGRGSPGEAYAADLERVIQDVGPGTVAAVVAEPVQGAGGLIVPPDDYFHHLRRVCDRHGALLIADEVITGFGRTGDWFAMGGYGVAPDLLIFAKGVTSGYLPLSGVMISAQVQQVLRAYGGALPHGFTYSGHPVACAVAARNLEILESERLVARAGRMGVRLREAMENLRRHEIVGDVRGRGLLAGVEFVADRATKQPFEASAGVARRVWRAALDRGAIFRFLPGDVIAASPPFVITESELDEAVAALDEAIGEVSRQL